MHVKIKVVILRFYFLILKTEFSEFVFYKHELIYTCVYIKHSIKTSALQNQAGEKQ